MNDLLLSAADLAKMDVNLVNVDLCRRFRKFAGSGNNLVFDRSAHRDNPHSQHLIRYINNEIAEHNRINNTDDTLEDFLRNYIRNLQPSALSEIKLRYGNKMLAIIDGSYKYPVYIKIDLEPKDVPGNTTKKQKMVVSFHEEYNPARGNIVELRRKDARSLEGYEYIAIISDDYLQNDAEKNSYQVRFLYPIGVNLIDVTIYDAMKTEGGYFIVPSTALNLEIVKQCRNFINDILDFSYEKGMSPTPTVINDVKSIIRNTSFTSTDFSFTSYGTTSQSFLSYCIDIKAGCMSNRFTGIPGKQISYIENAVSVLTDAYLYNCKDMTPEKAEQMMGFLEVRYAPHMGNHYMKTLISDIKEKLRRISCGNGAESERVIETKDSMEVFIDMSGTKPDIEEYKSAVINDIEVFAEKTVSDDTEGTGVEDPLLRSKLIW